MLPLDIATAIENFENGDENTFYVWVLPQLYVIRRSKIAAALKANRWTIIELFGAKGQVKDVDSGEVPWKGCVG
jgi:hypothetical protein